MKNFLLMAVAPLTLWGVFKFFQSAQNTQKLQKYIDTQSYLTSITVEKNGKILYQHFRKGFDENTASNTKSMSKSFLSLLVGQAIESGRIHSIDDPIYMYLKSTFDLLEAESTIDLAEKRKITIRHLLTMSSGLESVSGKNYDQWENSKDWLLNALSRPMISKPGKNFNYSTGNTHLLGAIVRDAVNMDLLTYAKQQIAAMDLKIQIKKWRKDKQGRYIGGNDLYLTPKAILAFGKFMLVSLKSKTNNWLVESTKKQISAAPLPPSATIMRDYGYLWWNFRIGEFRGFGAVGYGGQFLIIIEELDAVIAITSDWKNPSNEPRFGQISKMIEDLILPIVI